MFDMLPPDIALQMFEEMTEEELDMAKGMILCPMCGIYFSKDNSVHDHLCMDCSFEEDFKHVGDYTRLSENESDCIDSFYIDDFYNYDGSICYDED